MQRAFEDFILKLTSAPLLKLPELEKTSVIETDPSLEAVGTIFLQKKDDRKTHTIQFATRTMNRAEKKY